jgi:hypothetical protein
MTTYTAIRCYFEALLRPFLNPGANHDERAFGDDRGATIGEYIVITLASLAGAAVVGGIIWLALRNGAETVVVDQPAAP